MEFQTDPEPPIESLLLPLPICTPNTGPRRVSYSWHLTQAQHGGYTDSSCYCRESQLTDSEPAHCLSGKWSSETEFRSLAFIVVINPGEGNL